jgi:hypothetical protein
MISWTTDELEAGRKKEKAPPGERDEDERAEGEDDGTGGADDALAPVPADADGGFQVVASRRVARA